MKILNNISKCFLANTEVRSSANTQDPSSATKRVLGASAPIFSRLSGWFSNLLHPKLSTRKVSVSPANLAISAPLKPKNTYSVDQEAAKNYIECFKNPNEQQVIRKAIDHIQHKTWNDLDIGLKNCLPRLNECLHQKKTYAVGIDTGKSNEWVFQHSKSKLEKEPKTVLNLSNDILAVQENTVVLFDDCAYSGKQISEHIQKLIAKKKNLEIIVVIPFMTQGAIQRIKALQNSTAKIHIITDGNQSIKQVSEIFSNPELDIFKQRFFTSDDDGSTWHAFAAFNNEITLCYTDWRMPDELSFPLNFGRDQVETTSKNTVFIPPIPRIYGPKIGQTT